MSLDISYRVIAIGSIINTQESLRDIEKRLRAAVEDALGDNAYVSDITLLGDKHNEAQAKVDIEWIKEHRENPRHIIEAGPENG